MVFWISLMIAVFGISIGRAEVTSATLRQAFGTIQGSFVLRDCATGEETVFEEKTAETPFGPCSTFKIWNSLIGLEEGILSKPDALFWKWDGSKRNFADWNADQTWRSAFRVSCVPAFQELARQIGEKRMGEWLQKLDYGNKDQCGRPDAFWLPRAGQETIMITPRDQARMICRLIQGGLPVKAESVEKLTDVMKISQSTRGTLYGKTGSGLRSGWDGPRSDIDFDMGWFVGFLESGSRKYAYACLVLGPNLNGRDARRITEEAFQLAGMY